MSGERDYRIIEDYDLTTENAWNYEGTNYQLQSVDHCKSKTVEEFDNTKILTESKRKRLLKKYWDNTSELDSFEGRDTYSLVGLNLGIISIDKMKPLYRKRTDFNYKKPKGSKRDGFSVVSGQKNNRRVQDFSTLTKAKQYAKEKFLLNGENQSICYKYVDSYGRAVGRAAIGYMVGEKSGEYKSFPKKAPASVFIKPKYLYATTLLLTDYQYEFR